MFGYKIAGVASLHRTAQPLTKQRRAGDVMRGSYQTRRPFALSFHLAKLSASMLCSAPFGSLGKVNMDQCPCESGKKYDACCGPVIAGAETAATAEALMRSRYSAFVKKQVDYLRESLHPDYRHDYDSAASRQWAETSEWVKLEVLKTEGGGEDDKEGTVEFIATYRQKNATIPHHELGNFSRKNGMWYYTDGKLISQGTVRNEGPKIGRNDPCICDSGKKYKKCCGR